MVRLALLFLLVSCLERRLVAQPDKYICPLTWTPISFDAATLPPTAVAAHNDTQFVVRKRLNNLEYKVGSLDLETMRAHIPETDEGSDATVALQYEILTNPLACTVAWGPTGSEYTVYADGLHSAVIGRTRQSSDEFIVGPVTRNYINIALNGFTLRFRSYEVLLSYSLGLQISLTSVYLEDDDFGGGLDFLGLDEISNTGAATLSQEITHRKAFTQSHTFREGSFSETALKHGCSVNIDLSKYIGFNIKIPIDCTQTVGEFSSESVTFSQEQEVVVTRKVVVPPYSSVQVCSTVSMNEGFHTAYTAQAEYRIVGWPGVRVAAYLAARFGWNDMAVKENAALKLVDGTYEAAIALKTQFTVESAESDGCNIMRKAIHAAKVASRAGKY